jgi:hypothetical protein
MHYFWGGGEGVKGSDKKMSTRTPSSNPLLQIPLPTFLPIVSIVVFLAGILVRILTDDYIGIAWKNVGTAEPGGTELEGTTSTPTSALGTELLQPLQVALAPYVVVGESRVFTESEWSAFGIDNVQRHHFVKAGDYYFMPEGSVIPRGRTKSSIVKILQAFLTSSLYSRSWAQALWVTLADLLLLTTVEVLEGTLYAMFVLSVSFLSSNALPYMREHGKDNLMRIESCCGEYKHTTVLGFVLIAVAKSIDTNQKLFTNPLVAKAWMLLIPLIGIAVISVSILADDGKLGWDLAAGLMVGMGMTLLLEAIRTRPPSKQATKQSSTTAKAKLNPSPSRPYESYFSNYYPPIQW